MSSSKPKRVGTRANRNSYKANKCEIKAFNSCTDKEKAYLDNLSYIKTNKKRFTFLTKNFATEFSNEDDSITISSRLINLLCFTFRQGRSNVRRSITNYYIEKGYFNNTPRNSKGIVFTKLSCHSTSHKSQIHVKAKIQQDKELSKLKKNSGKKRLTLKFPQKSLSNFYNNKNGRENENGNYNENENENKNKRKRKKENFIKIPKNRKTLKFKNMGNVKSDHEPKKRRINSLPKTSLSLKDIIGDQENKNFSKKHKKIIKKIKFRKSLKKSIPIVDLNNTTTTTATTKRNTITNRNQKKDSWYGTKNQMTIKTNIIRLSEKKNKSACSKKNEKSIASQKKPIDKNLGLVCNCLDFSNDSTFVEYFDSPSEFVNFSDVMVDQLRKMQNPNLGTGFLQYTINISKAKFKSEPHVCELLKQKLLEK
ncbi:hypothetical protein M0813_27939 [Anaeramoeba flamelloides]|uniref:Uncharacterized protein n=1 Tax=Anaeramoeba flamelloides TaxID=1746091 RepID=A0ABQ8XW30_9EUKA|nr:hypothetical protein M0813_27939 [Anaeramoeba flamelloides]